MANLRARLPQLLVVLLGLLVALWYYNLEWEEKEIDLGPSPEARRNPVLALQRLLESRGQTVQFVRGFAGVERLQFANTDVGPNDTLVLLHTGRSLRQPQVDRLWQWLEAGGRALVAVDNPHFDMTALDSDPLLDQLGLGLAGRYWDTLAEEDDAGDEERTSEDEANAESPVTSDEESGTVDASSPADKNRDETATGDDKADNSNNEAAQSECRWRDVTVPVTLDEHDDVELQMEFVSGISFADMGTEARVLSAYEDKLFLLHQSVGAGEIYAIPTMQALHNENIHCLDNAYVAWKLIGDSDKVWLVLNADSPSFWRHLWELSAFGCVALLAALAIWLWHRVPRFGPVLESRTTGRRQFLDHIQATAQFLFRKQGSAALITPLREEILQKLRLRHPGFPHLSTDDQIAKVVQLSGMTRADVQLALYRPLPVPDLVFVDMVQRLQHLRNAL